MVLGMFKEESRLGHRQASDGADVSLLSGILPSNCTERDDQAERERSVKNRTR